MNVSTSTVGNEQQIEYDNISQIQDYLKNSPSEIVEMLYQVLFFIVGAPLNIMVFVQSCRKHRNGCIESRLLKLSRQLIITHLMVLSMCLWRTHWFYNIVWNQGNLLCKVYSFAYALPFHLWSNMVAAIAIDMLCCITSPLSSYRNGSKRVNYLIGISWVSAICCSAPMLYFKGTVPIDFPQHNLVQCYLTQKFVKYASAWNTFHVVTVFYVPLLIVIVCYALIGISLRKQIAKRKCLQDESQSYQASHTKVRFLRATIAIITSFVLTWLPYQIMALLRVLCSEGSSCTNIYSKLNWTQAIMIASTCINPFLYKFGNFREKKRASTTVGSMFESGAAGGSVNHGSCYYAKYAANGTTITERAANRELVCSAIQSKKVSLNNCDLTRLSKNKNLMTGNIKYKTIGKPRKMAKTSLAVKDYSMVSRLYRRRSSA
uniref:G_PROTEIN_RECEP_F1_2 domain-containing protein n=1 Tax=Rhabditophanes sp. KR3021 TaxID=114890 RepID=A0AC35U666_9BILA